MKRKFLRRLLICSVIGMLGLTACGNGTAGGATDGGNGTAGEEIGEANTGTGEDARGAEEMREWSEEDLEARADAEGIRVSDIAAADLAELPEAHRNAYVDYALELFRQSHTAGENSMISPASVMFAMDMVAMGAKGETLSQMTDTLTPGLSSEESVSLAYSFMQRINNSNGVEFHVANSAWIEESVLGGVIEDSYVENLEEYFDAEAEVLPFDTAAIDAINGWVDDNTEGMIDEIIREFPSEDTVLVLINAIAFEGEWADQFGQHQILEGTFANADGTEADADMLSSTEGDYFETADATGFMKYYAGYEYAFMAILPEEGMSAEEYLENLDGERYREFWESRTTDYDVNIQMPRFEYDYELGLNEILQNMGIEDAFNPFLSNLTGIADDPAIQLMISEVIHKTHIELDENGTRAAAVTAIMVDNRMAMMPAETREVILDRPFVYAIVDVNTGMPVFMGVVNNL